MPTAKASKNSGKKFEAEFIKSIPKEMFCYRFRDSANAWNKTDNQKIRFTTNNICDFLVFNTLKNELVLLELKSTKQKSLSFTNIKKNQIEGLLKAQTYSGVQAYFIINFRKIAETYAVPVNALNNFIKTTTKKSINSSEVKEIGILIPQQLLKVNYKYNLSNFLN